MKNISLNQISQYLNQDCVISGWACNFRSSGAIAFLQIRDGSSFVQAIIVKSIVSDELWNTFSKITLESSVEVTGTVSKHPKKEEYEIQVSNLTIINQAAEYPLGKKDHGPDFLLDNRHLWLRSPSQWAIQRVRNTVINATYDYFRQNDFIKIDSPILTSTSCEATTELFEMKYFDLGKAYLSQSGQLYLEAAIAAHGKVFDFGPVFRAEKSKTRRHLTEFWMMDAEMAFCRHQDNMRVQEELISYIVHQVLQVCKDELKILEREIESLAKIIPPFYRLTHTEAVKILRGLGSDIKEDDDLGADDETLLTQKYDKPIFIEKYPAKIKAFYMKRDPENPELVLNNDLLAPEGFGEIIGGSEREDDYEALLKRMKEHKMPVEPFQWYLDLRQYGAVPHSGFGYGLERITAWLCGIHHIRETIPFPRTINRLTP